MTATRKRVAAPNALIFILDPVVGDIPRTLGGASIVDTKSCIAIGCQPDCDGETEVTLGVGSDVDPGEAADFECELESPSGVLSVQTVLGEVIAEVPVKRERTRVRVWVNHPTEPDKVIIGIE